MLDLTRIKANGTRLARMITDRDALGHATFLAEGPDLLGFASYAQFRGGVGYATCMEHSVILAPQARGRAGRLWRTSLCAASSLTP